MISCVLTMIRSSLCTHRLCSVRLNFWKLRGRHCPRRPSQLATQKKILHLAQKKDTPASGCSFELLMDESMVDAPSANVNPPLETRECTASVQVRGWSRKPLPGGRARGLWTTKLERAMQSQVDASLLRFIVGKGGKVKEKIEKDTTTHLQIPPPREAKRGSCLVVKGSSQANVDDAVSQIYHVLEEAAESPSLDYSHFISLPLALHPDLVVQVTKFHDSVMALFPAKSKDGSVESSSLSPVKSSNQSEETEAFEREKVSDMGQTYANHSEERKAFDTEQVSDWGCTSAIHKEGMEAFETEHDGRLGQSNTETLPNEQDKELDLDCDSPDTLKELDDGAGIPRLLQKGHGIEDSIFIKPATFHLTVLMLKLWSKDRVAAAVEVLQGLHSKLLEALDHRPVAVRLKGVECMRGSPAKAHVLYARVEDADHENRLLCACKVIKDAFIEAGLVSEKDKKQELQLHATLMNTSHRKRKRGKKFGRRMPFDARPILSKHGSEDWGEYTINEAHLSERFVYDEGGYYHCCGLVKFPPLSLTT